MTGSTRPHLARAIGYSLAATALYLATLVAVFGIVSLLADIDVIDTPGAGPAMGIVPVIGSALVFAGLALRALDRDTRAAGRRPGSRVLAGILAGAAVWLTYGLGIAAVTLLDSGSVAPALEALGRAMLRPFGLSAGLIAAVLLAALLAVSAAAVRGRTPRHWPWEDGEDHAGDSTDPRNRPGA